MQEIQELKMSIYVVVKFILGSILSSLFVLVYVM